MFDCIFLGSLIAHLQDLNKLSAPAKGKPLVVLEVIPVGWHYELRFISMGLEVPHP